MRKLPAVLSTSLLALILGANINQFEMFSHSVHPLTPSHPLLTRDSDEQSEHRGSGRAESLGSNFPSPLSGGV